MKSTESPMKAAANPASTDAVASFVEQMGMLLFGADADVMDRSVRTPQADEALSKFINDNEVSTLEVYLTGTEVIITTEWNGALIEDHASAFALIKTVDSVLESSKPIAAQVQVMSISCFDRGKGEDGGSAVLQSMQQMTKHVFSPLARYIRSIHESSEQKHVDYDEENDQSVILQKRVRDLELLLENLQRGSGIPSIHIPIPPSLVEFAKTANAPAMKILLEKYNASQVDVLFNEMRLSPVIRENEEEFANEVNKTARQWPAEIIRQTKLINSPFAGSIEKEINFWKDLERKLADTKDQLESAPILLTKLVLKRTNRISEQLIIEAETVLDRAMETVKASLAFIRDFPLTELEEANSLPKINRCTTNCMAQFAKMRHSTYDFSRALKFLEMLGALILSRVVTIFQQKNTLLCATEDVRLLKAQFDQVLTTWKSQLVTQKGTLKDVARRRNEKMPNMKFDFDALHSRIQELFLFREQHEKMLSTLTQVLSGAEGDFLSELTDAYQLFVRSMTTPFDLTSNGQATWTATVQQYERRLEKVEERVTQILADRLSSCKSADDMFRIFALFNPLFFRPNIRNAVNSFRATLMKSVRDDVMRLQEKSRHRYDESQEKVVAGLRDIPPLSGAIIWARQIENQLKMLMHRIQDVLGVGWEDHLEGKQLKEVCDKLRSDLDINQIYEDWKLRNLQADESKYRATNDFLFLIENETRTGLKILKVNFEERQVQVYKEVKYLEWLLPNTDIQNKIIPSTIKTRAQEAFVRYPVALALQSTLANYLNAYRKLTPSNTPLLISQLQEVREAFNEAICGTTKRKWVKWSSTDLNDWVSQISSKVNNLQERVDDISKKVLLADRYVSELKTCEYDVGAMTRCLDSLQTIIDELPVKVLSNVPQWVAQLDRKVESVLVERLREAVKAWTKAFEEDYQNMDFMSVRGRGNRGVQFQFSAKAQPDEPIIAGLALNPIFHEVVLSNQVLYLQPSLEETRRFWMTELHQYFSIVCGLPRLVANRFKVFGESGVQTALMTSIFSSVEESLVRLAYETIEKKISAARLFSRQWLQYQALWDASVSVVTEPLGSDLVKWQAFLDDIKKARAAIDTSYEEKSFGPIVINHRQVQNKINVKYDSWQRDAQNRFGIFVIADIRQQQVDLVAIKSRLEALSLEGSTKEAIAAVEFITKTREQVESMEQKIAVLKSSEKLLQSQRYSFPQEWVPVSNVLGIFQDVCSILERRTNTMNAQLPALQQKIKEEDVSISSRLEKFVENWNIQKPVEGTLSHTSALETLSLFQGQLNVLLDDYNRLRSAKESLNMDYTSDERLNFISSEIFDLREAWAAVSPVSEKLILLTDTLMKDCNPATTRKLLEELITQLKTVSPKVRGYSSVETMYERVQKYLAFQPVLRDLCTDALKDRHWKMLLEKIGIKQQPKNVTLGHIWDSQAMNQRKVIQEILSTAQGEAALEQFLKDLRENWLTREFTVIVRDSAKIVVGWDVLFTALEDNLSSLGSIKQSPYFKNVPEFQEESVGWESRLTNVRVILELWVEVQRKWLYLRGIFKNADIKAQLPAQFSKYKSIDAEYVSLMKRVSAKPIVLDILQFDNLTRQLEREESIMTLIQKALGEYLERQRQIFPRFYFVNNDDLIEIIGNSNEPSKVMLHLGKMFAAIGTLTHDPTEEGASSLIAPAMVSKEGEIVKFGNAIDLSVGVKEWLTQVLNEMLSTLSTMVDASQRELMNVGENILAWMEKYPAQVVILASQILWTMLVDSALQPSKREALSSVVTLLEERLKLLSLSVLNEMEVDLRRKCEQLLTEMVHQRDVARILFNQRVTSSSDFSWLYQLRFYWNAEGKIPQDKLSIRISNASFQYGFEYLGVAERLVQTPLTDRCYLTLTQALHFRMGGNPFGPAGTGKTESVKMLGAQLGRFVLVFNCDSAFDYAAMGRIFSGLCQVGAWGCFDEFNRLEERILSAVSQQILTIQRGLMNDAKDIDMLGQQCKLSKDVGIFVTLNPGYAGRSNLPDNLKQLFRAVAMSVPDRKLIAQVMLFSQGIASAEDLAGKIVLLFVMCEEQLSTQSHYDFGLRALKSVLVGAGELKRQALIRQETASVSETLIEMETKVLITSACDSILPKLVADDIPLFISLLSAVFPGCQLPTVDDKILMDAVMRICEEEDFVPNHSWLSKVMQLKQVQDIRHGIMLVGSSGSGKTSAWRVLLKALSRVDGVKADSFVIDPKAVDKNHLFGSLDPNTLEWTDGVFTKILRRINDSSSVRTSRRSWIIFDGDVDPEWAENLNSVLDDNKILTLPSGDRLRIPSNVRIIAEVDSLKYATLATVSRCGMVWFANSVVTLDMAFTRRLNTLSKVDIRAMLESGSIATNMTDSQKNVQAKFVEALRPQFLNRPAVVEIVLDFAMSETHVMEPRSDRLIATLFAMLTRGLHLLFEHNDSNPDFPIADDQIQSFAVKWLAFSMIWSFGSSATMARRAEIAKVIDDHLVVKKNGKASLLDLFPNVADGEWVEWNSFVPRMEIESHRVSSSDVVITTTDTVRHTEVLKAWLASRMPLILCGPPGSGKTMTLTAVLEAMPDFILASLNFSSGTTPDLILKTLAQYCEIVDSPDGPVMQPNRQSYRDSQWLVVFCDEINLPAADAYGTQTVITFLRQLTEQGGFWQHDCKWIMLRRIQFVGACNPPSDAGRVDLSRRFLRHAPVLLVDYPAEESLKQIYRCFNQALLRPYPNLRAFTDPLNDAMVEFYLTNKDKFTADMAPQYIYSPRELSRWMRALYEAIEPLDAMTAEELVRLWAHEALRLFQDRLIDVEDREWCSDLVDEVAAKYFPAVNVNQCLKRPILYSQWIKKTYQSADIDVLRDFVAARLKVFYEEELDVPLVIFDEVLDHVLRIDNVLRHPIGHMLLVGESGVGKTVLTKFVAWTNGLSVFQIKANNKYTIDQFDEDLRTLFRRVGVDGEKICFIFDESNALSSAFLERMNALLASGEVPGLFEGDERAQLMAACRESFNQREGLVLDSEDELYRRFTKVIQRNLHVIFTMNPASADFADRCTTSPALFNRCVVDWFGTWSDEALTQVAYDFTKRVDTGFVNYTEPTKVPEMLNLVCNVLKTESITMTEAVVASLVSMHSLAKKTVNRVGKSTGRQHYLSPRDFLDLINKFLKTEEEKRTALEEQQGHIRTGLQKLLETQDQVFELNKELTIKKEILRHKDQEANQKLTLMVEKQNEAEQRKTVAENLTRELEVQNHEITVRKEVVEKELAEAEPALQSAKQSVQSIRKTQLDELRNLTRPPPAVRVTMEMVCVMMGENGADWNEVRKIIRREDFIPTVVNFDPLQLTAKQIKTVQENYLSSADLDYAAVDRASKACGPLFNWAVSQIKYATILKKIKPLRDEMAAIEEQSKDLVIRQQQAVQEVAELESMIKKYKDEYKTAIREIEVINTELESVSNRVVRADALLNSLQEEKARWQSTSESFNQQMATLIGDCLLSSAFLTYSGIFDHRIRLLVMEEWVEIVKSLNIPFRDELNVVTYLSKPADIIHWQECGLPNDTLAVQNAILLERYNRFPLVIDPAGQALKFILNKYSNQRIVQTSFLDSNFLKTLASAIRFGTPLLVQDVESIDPVLNPVLNREIQRTGGRSLIRLGNEDIDFSPKFLIILLTRNPAARLSPDLCSRVTTVNFTITPASLESQVLSEILRSERPDIDKRRSDVLKLQGEQNAKMRELEDKLLNKISAVQGAILDDDTVIHTLEGIKAEAAQLSTEVSKTVEVLEEVRVVSSAYASLATAVSTVYFTLESLGEVNALYQYSLQFFLSVVNGVLSGGNNKSTATAGGATRSANDLKGALFRELSKRILPGLLYVDKIVFLTRIGQILASNANQIELTDAETDFLTKGPVQVDEGSATASIQRFRGLLADVHLTEAQIKNLVALVRLPAFSGLESSFASKVDEWHAFLVTDAETGVGVMPSDWFATSDSAERKILLRALLLRVFAPERVIRVLEEYLTTTFQKLGFDWRAFCVVDLKRIVAVVSQSSRPLMLCSQPGQDASGKVDALSSTLRKTLLQVSMGSAEGFGEAEKIIAQASKTGAWVLLRNVHLCPDWLNFLEKKLFGMTLHDEFRLFLTCEIHPKLSTALLRRSEIIVFESSSGLKANLQRFYLNIPVQRLEKQPVERGRLYSLLAWFNAVVQERLRYAPLGWTKRYEFTDSDLNCALDVIDQWLDDSAGNRAHIDPGQIPWKALKTLLAESIYGGRVDQRFDQIALEAFIESIFTPKNYAAEASLVHDTTTALSLLKLPDSLTRQSFEMWIKDLPEANPPQWIGLPSTAETQLQRLETQKALSRLALLQGLVLSATAVEDGANSVQQAQQKQALEALVQWTNLLTAPAAIQAAIAALNGQQTVTARHFVRELNRALSVLDVILADLSAAQTFLSGGGKMTNIIRELLAAYRTGLVPRRWLALYSTTEAMSLTQWLENLRQRLQFVCFLGGWTGASTFACTLGLMFNSEAFIIAVRQLTAQENKWGLEDLELYLDIGGDSLLPGIPQDVLVNGLLVQGASWTSQNYLAFSDDLHSNLPTCKLKWRPRGIMDRDGSSLTLLPVYSGDSRKSLVSQVLVATAPGRPSPQWAQRSVALLLQGPLN